MGFKRIMSLLLALALGVCLVPISANAAAETNMLTVCYENGHILQYVEGIQTDNHLENGVYDHYRCTVCNKLFMDEEGQERIALADTVALSRHAMMQADPSIAQYMPHEGNLTTETVAPTCMSHGYDRVTCDCCGISWNKNTTNPLIHQLEENRCNLCGEYFVAWGSAGEDGSSWYLTESGVLQLVGSAITEAGWAEYASRITRIEMNIYDYLIEEPIQYPNVTSVYVDFVISSFGNLFANTPALESFAYGPAARMFAVRNGVVYVGVAGASVETYIPAMSDHPKVMILQGMSISANSLLRADQAEVIKFGGWYLDEGVLDGCTSLKEFHFLGNIESDFVTVIPKDVTIYAYANGMIATAEGERTILEYAEANGYQTAEIPVCEKYGHGAVYMEEIPETDEQAGQKAHYQCPDCGACFEDADAQTPVTAEQLIIPAIPAAKVSGVSSTGKNKVSWKKAEGAVKYQVYRATSKSGTYTKIKTTTSTSYTDTSAKAGTKYYYKVRAVDEFGTKSEYSSIVSRTCDLARPEIKVKGVDSSGKNKISWDKISGAEKYYVYRATSKSGTYTKIKTTTSTSYTDSSAKAGTKYYYKVKAIHEKSSANSAYSEIVSRTCDLARPNVTIKLSKGDPKLSWSKISGAKQYKIYRATSKSGTYKLIKTTTSTSYTDTSAKAGKTYYYKVVAVHKTSAANSAYSSVDSIKAK